MRKKTLLITGGSQGIGRATVEHFLRKDWRVVFVARNPDGIARSVDELAAAGFGSDVVQGLALDVGDLDAVCALPSRCEFFSDGMDALVLNAFYQKIKPAQELTAEDLNQHWKVNNLSPIMLVNASFAKLQECRGAVVYVSSIMDERLAPGYAAYGASKAYMKAFVRHAALDYGPQGVRINVVSPGLVRTDALQRAIDVEGLEGRAKSEEMLRQVPMENRCAEPAEIAEAIWFAITGPRYFHGRDLRIDGGFI